MSATATRNGKTAAKKRTAAERFNWKPLSVRGRLEWLDKNLLNVDHDYQRDKVYQSRVLDIARDWDWPSCGTISVAKRQDGTFWVFDGQHRVGAAKKRDDIQEVPCFVFDMGDITEEAQAFVNANTVRGPVRALERFKARLIANDPIALEVAALVEQVGYSVAAGGGESFKLQCVASIEKAVVRDRNGAEIVLTLCAEIYAGESIHSKVFDALCYVHQLLKSTGESIARSDIRKKLLALGTKQLERAVNSAVGYHGRGGERVYADGIVRLVNKGKRTQQLPAPIQ